MLESTLDIPAPIVAETERLLGVNLFRDAQRLLRLSKATISFSKGSPESYFIVSGIIRDRRPHETKIVYKKRLEGTDEPPLSSNCDCEQWSEENHCPHVACLFVNFHMRLYQENYYKENPNESRPPIPLGSSLGVNVLNYGSIINGPQYLQGAGSNTTYSALQYLLHNKKVINFPIPNKFTGKLQIRLNSTKRINEFIEANKDFDEISFKYREENGDLVDEISIFENLYLFDWREGIAYHLPNELKTFIQTIRIRLQSLSINDLLQLSTAEVLHPFLEVVIDEKPLEEIPLIKANTQINLEPGSKKTQLQFSIVFHDENENIIPIPQFISTFTFQGGLLSSFKKKKDAYNFVGELVVSQKDDSDTHKRTLITSQKRDKIQSLIEFTRNNENTLLYDEKNEQLCQYDNTFLQDLLASLHDCFGDMFFRYSEYEEESLRVSYQVSGSVLFQGLADFHTKMLPFGVNIFYDRNEITTWNSRIRFERRASSTKWFDLELNISQADLEIIKKADLDNQLALIKSGLVLLKKDQKDLLRLMKKYTQYEATEQTSEGSSDEDEEKKFILPFNRARIFELFELKKLGIDGALTDEELALCERLATLENVPDYELPDHLKDVMRPYQKTGYNWLKFLHENKLGACLADDMGLGKTLQSIAFIQSIHDQIDRVLIVCPVTILLNWEKEIKKFSDLDLYIYHGDSRTFPEKTKIVLTSYGVMKKEVDLTFKDKHFDIFILDEVQHLKNMRSLGAFAARKIQADFRICLTGTPVENDLAEFYNILDLSIPGVWGDLQFVRTTSNQKSRLLARKTASPFILRRTKAQVLHDLPPKIENNVYLNLTDEEKDRYDQSLLNIKQKIEISPSKKKYGEILKGLLELRQRCLWQNTSSRKTIDIRSIESTKINFLTESLEQILEEGHQAIVFSQFTTYLDIIENVFRERHWKFSRIDGTQSAKKRQKEVDTFQGGNTSIFLISLKAGGVGLNLTAASYVFVMDPWWNPAVEAQAIDRAHRIGQKNTLTVYRPIIKGSVEEKVLQLQEMKKRLFYDLLPEDDDQLFTGKLSMKDFEQLFS